MDLQSHWESYWRDCEAGGSTDRDRLAARQAWLAGAAASWLRARRAGVSAAGRELYRQATGELCGDLGPTVGLRKLPPPPAGYSCS